MSPAPASAPTDALYALPPDEFVAARNALAKQLKADGDKAQAAEVAKLRRPTPGAWALNQVARADPALVAAALDAGVSLRAASDAALAGDASGLRAATSAERAAAQAVLKAAGAHLSARAGSLETALVATLRAAALDEGVADELRRGVLTAEQEQPGFGFGLGDDVTAPAARRPSPKKVAKKPALRAVPDLPPAPDPAIAARAKADRQAKKEREARRRTADRLTKEATRLAKEADAAEADAQAARTKANEAEHRAESARQAVDP